LASLVELLARLVSWWNAIRTAEIDSDRYLRSAKLSAKELGAELSSEPDAARFAEVAARIGECSDLGEIAEIATMMLCSAVPLPLFNREGPRSQLRPPASHEGEIGRIAVAFSSFEIDGKPFADPQTMQPEVIYDLTVNSSLSRWPGEALQVILSPLSVEPTGTHELPIFQFNRPVGAPPYLLTKTGRMLVKFPISFFARPLEFSYTARLVPEPGDSSVLVQGQRRLRVRCFDPSCASQSGYVEVEKRLVEIRDQAKQVPAIMDSELNDFLVLLSCIGGVAGQSLQGHLFPRKYSEAEFQDEMKRLLRSNPRVGSELEEHPHAARGITDLSFRRMRIELKVEASRRVGIADASVFLQQTAQYVAGSDRRFGILCLLDCSDKTEAPGTVANDIALEKVEAPGGTLPICLGVVVLRGNLQRPSSFS
jgi:hypothetical protein